ncbi:MAG: aspartyl/asparaginyl beta-hydroxylase domain-containing protein [Lysobacterales bacterium]
MLANAYALPADIFRAPPHKLPQRFQTLGQVDVSAIRARLAGKTADDWAANALRQQTFSVHRDTQSLVMKWCANSGTDTPVETTATFAEFEDLLAPILALIQSHYRYERPVIRKAMFAKLRAGGVISGHVDAAVAIRMVHRIHVPIITHPDVHFYIDEIDHHFHEGQVFEVDNTRYHSVKNDSPLDRVHLIIDYYHL